MVGIYKIPLAIFFLLCFSFCSFAEEKVYTNKDLRRDPSLNKVSVADQRPEKAINPKHASRGTWGPESILRSAKHTASTFIHQIRTNKIAQAVTIGILFLIWIAFMLFRLSRQE